MPMNPERAARGGDVEGTTKTDIDYGSGDPITVAKASFEPGYEIGNTQVYTTVADTIRGYCNYGIAIGEARGNGKLGGNSYIGGNRSGKGG